MDHNNVGVDEEIAIYIDPDSEEHFLSLQTSDACYHVSLSEAQTLVVAIINGASEYGRRRNAEHN